MALFHPASGRWADRHFVLTKAGFLHWLASMDELEPLDCLNLSRCQFESSQDAQINIAESLGGKVGSDLHQGSAPAYRGNGSQSRTNLSWLN